MCLKMLAENRHTENQGGAGRTSTAFGKGLKEEKQQQMHTFEEITTGLNLLLGGSKGGSYVITQGNCLGAAKPCLAAQE